MPSGEHPTGRPPEKAGNVYITKKNTKSRRPTYALKATQKQQVAAPNGVPAIPKHSKTTQEERPATRRSTRIQQLTGNSARPPVFEELPPIKRPPRKRKVNVIQPTETAFEAATSETSPRLSKKGDQSPVDNPALSPVSRTRLQNQPLLSWLENVDSPVSENPQISDPTDSFKMPEYSSSVIEAPTLVSRTATTQRTIRPQISRQKFMKLLQARNAFPSKKTKDDQTEQFLSAFEISEHSTSIFDGTNELWRLISSLDGYKRNLSGNSSSREEIEQLVERMTDELHKWRTMLDLATITQSEFDNDLTRCQNSISNEAEIQRTLLPEIINRHQLKEMFIFRFEGQWKSRGTGALPSTDPMDDGISAPKPDLAIFFNHEALGPNSAPIPHDIEESLRPAGHASLCFPFLFIEMKKRYDPLDPALEKNLHTANQALFNIFRWIKKAEKLDDFFKNVRTFSIAMNAREIIARVHRAEPSTGSLPLNYAYDDLRTISPFSKKQACKLIKSILEYGAQKLCEILRDTFQTVSELYAEGNYPEDKLTKRKNDDIKPTYPWKKPRSKGKRRQTADSQESESDMSFSTSGTSLNDA